MGLNDDTLTHSDSTYLSDAIPLTIDNINQLSQRIGSPMVSVIINNKQVQGLLDSGATCSCMTTSMAERIFGSDWPSRAQHSDLHLAGADSNKLDIKGEILTNLKIGDREFEQRIVVYKPIHSRDVLLLGNDLFVDNFANIGGRFLSPLDGQGQPTKQRIPISYRPKARKVAIKTDCIIRAQSRHVIKGQLPSDDHVEWTGQNVIFDPETMEANCLLSAPEIITKVLPAQSIDIPVENYTDQDIHIRSGELIGYANIVQDANGDRHIDGNDNYEVLRESFPLEQTIGQIQECIMSVRDNNDVYRHHAEIHDADGEQEILKGSSDGLIPPPPGVELHDESEIDLEKDLKMSHLTPHQQTQLRKLLLEKHVKIFAKSDVDIGTTDILEHHIDVGDSKPVAVPYRPVPHHYRDEVDKLLKQLLKIGVIGYAKSSPWASNMVIVRKKNTNKIRCCIDFRNVNLLTRNRNCWPIRNIEVSFTKFQKAKFISSLDLVNAYWTLRMNKESAPITGFFGVNGEHLQWLRMPFGLSASPSSYNQVMAQVLRGTSDFSFHYFDDVVIFSDTFDQHLQHLDEVIDRFAKAGFKLKMSKCHFAQTKDIPLEWLGSVIKDGHVFPDKAKVEAIKNLPAPTKPKQLLSFLGAVSFHRKHIKDFAAITSCLFDLAKPTATFEWKQEHQIAFEKIKEKLMTAPGLALPDMTRPFTVTTDASGVGVGAALSFTDKNGQQRICGYASRKFNDLEKLHLSTPEKELHAIIYALRTFSFYLLNKKFTLQTDARSVLFCKKYNGLNSKISRIALWLSEFDFDIKHVSAKRGNLMAVADCLSRSYNEPTEIVSYKGLRNPQLNQLPNPEFDTMTKSEFDKFADNYWEQNPIDVKYDDEPIDAIVQLCKPKQSPTADNADDDNTHDKRSFFDEAEFIQTTSLINTELTWKSFKKLQDDDLEIQGILNQDPLPSQYFIRKNLLMHKGPDRQI